jgi:hypothetical protein
MSFPVTARYFLNFRNSDTGLTPAFVFFKEAVAPFNDVAPPTVVERSNGMYWFDWTWTTPTDVDIIFEVDGGPSIPTEEVRYIKGTISPRDRFLDEPISQIVTDVWTDSASYAAGQKGKRVDDIGAANDTSATPSLFGKTLLYKENIRGDAPGMSDGNDVKQVYTRIGAPVSSNISTDIANVQSTTNTINTKLGTPAGPSVSADIADVKSDTAAIKLKTDNLPTDPASQSATNTSITNAISSIKGADSRDLTQIAGAGTFIPGTDDLHQIKSSISSPNTIAGAVFDELLAGHTIPGSAGAKLASTASSADVSAAQASIKGIGNIDNTQTYNRLGPPSGASMSDDIASIKSDTSVINTGTAAIAAKLTRALGLMHENSVLDQTVFDGQNNLTNARLRIYDSKANALLAGVTGLLHTYTISASYVGENVQTYTVVLES